VNPNKYLDDWNTLCCRTPTFESAEISLPSTSRPLQTLLSGHYAYSYQFAQFDSAHTAWAPLQHKHQPNPHKWESPSSMLKHITTFPFTKHPCVSRCSQQTSILYTPLRASMAHIACSLVSYLRKAQPITTCSKVSIIPWQHNSMPTLTQGISCHHY
jgi:hypothetical protein